MICPVCSFSLSDQWRLFILHAVRCYFRTSEAVFVFLSFAFFFNFFRTFCSLFHFNLSFFSLSFRFPPFRYRCSDFARVLWRFCSHTACFFLFPWLWRLKNNYWFISLELEKPMSLHLQFEIFSPERQESSTSCSSLLQILFSLLDNEASPALSPSQLTHVQDIVDAAKAERVRGPRKRERESKVGKRESSFHAFPVCYSDSFSVHIFFSNKRTRFECVFSKCCSHECQGFVMLQPRPEGNHKKECSGQRKDVG